MSGEYSTIKEIGNEAFEGCHWLGLFTHFEIELPSGLIAIGDEAYRNCMYLKKVIVPDTVTSIGNKAFISCDNLESIILPDSVSTIGEKAFAYLKNITVTVGKDSYAKQYCQENDVNYTYADSSNDWLNN